MMPYYDEGGITIYHGDCRDILPGLGSVADVFIADPPYGDTSLDWDVPVQDWLRHTTATLTAWGSLWCFGSMRMLMSQARQFDGWKMAQDVVWEKHNGSSFHADRFKRVHEHIVQFYPADVSWSQVYKSPVTTPDATKRTTRRKTRPTHTGHIEAGTYTSDDGGPRLMRSVINVRSCHGYAIHPTQKPVGILIPLIEYSCPIGGIVVDPFMGVGSSLEAAKLTGRKAIGIDTNERWCEAAALRLSQGVFDLEVTA